LKQTQYAKDMLARFGMSNVRPAATPADPDVVLSAAMSPHSEEEKQIMQSLPVLELGGALLYLARMTRPDCAFAINDILRYSAVAGPAHWAAMQRLCSYIAGTVDRGVTLGGIAPTPEVQALLAEVDIQLRSGEFYVYCDADHARNPDTRRSTSGHVFMMNSGPIAWNVKYQRSVAKSSTTAEYYSVDSAVDTIIDLRLLAEELGMAVQTPTVVFEDNTSALQLMESPVVTTDVGRHLAIRHFRIREQVEAEVVQLIYVPTQHQIADIMTKPLGRLIHQRLAPLLMGRPSEVPAAA
jgi:hypothetical protein